MSSAETFSYQEDDPSGLHTLQAISKADNFNQWMYNEVSPWLSGNILEIGSGIGNISTYFLQNNQRLTLSDIRPVYVDFLKQRFPEHAENILTMDLVDPDFRKKYAMMQGKFDAVFALNVIEHIKDDRLAVANIHFLLKPGGTFVMLVPAHGFLYNKLDRFLMHFRRYTSGMAKELLRSAGFKVEHTWFFNSLGIPAWLWGGLGRGKEIKPGQMALYDRLVPLIKVADRILGKRVGLSVVIAGIKSDK